jgi:transcriptional regulator with XRE-family HTH domain
MDTIYQQIKKRRLDLKLLQSDLKKLIGMEQTQYQRIETGGNPNLHTLQRLLKALRLNIVLVPNEKMDFILPLLEAIDKNDQPKGPDSLLDKFRVDDE